MEVLLEIGLEEIPARFLVPALKNIELKIEKELKEKRLNYAEIKTYGTPRRLVLHILDLEEKQEDITVQNTGPAKSVAYDPSGQPTKAAIGFVKSQGIDIKELEIIKTPKGEYIAVTKHEKGQLTAQLLPEMLKELILNISFPKSMRWGDKKLRFVRPIRWILAMQDNELIEFQIEDIASELKSCGHRFFGEKEFKVKSIDDYFNKLKRNYVVVDMEKRKEDILTEIKSKTSKVGETVLIEDGLLNEVANLIEYPYPITGTFNAEFLEVPQEVLIITMQTHQRYFPVLDEDGKLMPKFIVIRNGIEYSEEVKKGNEKVLGARLSDARFFYYEDLKKNIEFFNNGLKKVVFQNKLGTVYEKVTRNVKIAAKLCNALKLTDEKKEDVLRTVEISKFDLMTNMISEKEYTKLQGFMGMKYAIKFGEKENVAQGIYEHYLPRYQGDKLPQSYEGIVAAISDKLDTIVGCFTVGLIPKGSQDPYALRRAALGIVNIILKFKLDISLFKAIDHSLDLYKEAGILQGDKSEVAKNIRVFFKDRIINVLSKIKARKDIVEAVVTADYESILEVDKKIEILEKLIEQKEFTDIVLLIKRVRNISKNFEESNVSTKVDLLEEKEEKDLYKYYETLKENTKINLAKREYASFFDDVLQGKEIINKFFDNIMVMDKNPKIKQNRLSLLKSLDTIFNNVAIITMINS